MKELDRVADAVATLKLVASHLHTPLDTAELEAALAALKAKLASPAPKPVAKPSA